MTNTRRKSLISTWSYKAVNGQKGPLVTMKLGSIGMSTSHWYAVVALWFAPGAVAYDRIAVTYSHRTSHFYV